MKYLVVIFALVLATCMAAPQFYGGYPGGYGGYSPYGGGGFGGLITHPTLTTLYYY